MKKIIFKLTIILILAVVLSLSLAFSIVQAQTTTSITVAPARQELTVKPGEETAVEVRFYNQGGEPVSGLLRIADFLVQDKEGTPKIVEDLTQIAPRFAASSWVKLPFNRMTIAAKDKVTIQAKIAVPADARPGGRYFAIYFEPVTTPPRPKGAPYEAGTGVAPRVVSLVSLRVAGPIKEAALVTQFSAPRFSQYGPVTITTEISNRGDYHIRPKGVITVTDFLGRLVGQSLLEEKNIFPDAARIYENKIGKKWMFGRFKANLQATFGEKGKVLTASLYFWVFPWKEATVIVLTLVIIGLLLARLGRKAKKKEKELAAALKEKEEELKKLKEELKKKQSE